MNNVARIDVCRIGRRFYSARTFLDDRGIYEDVFPEKCAPEIKQRYHHQLSSAAGETVYAGFDPTAPSLHVGNLLVIMNLLRWQRKGHNVIALIGGATGRIGDPSHRTSERDKIDCDIIDGNTSKISGNVLNIFNNHEKHFLNDRVKLKSKVKIVNNIEWYENMNVLEFIGNIGRHFRMGTMLGRTSVQSRLNSETGMSFCEFSYSIFQGYDWWRLFERYNCRFQLGGSDQMGNIVSGHDLISRVSGVQVYGLTLPLITTAGGRKFGKSAGNAIWLDNEMSSPFEFYQYFMRTRDDDIERFLRYFTFLELEDIKDIVRRHKERPEERNAQRILADNCTLLVHGEEGLESAQRVTRALYSTSLESLSSLLPTDFMTSFEGAKCVEIPSQQGITVLEVAIRANCFKTEQDAKRIIAAGGFYVNNNRVSNMEEVLVPGIHVLRNNLTVLRTGKRNYYIVKWR